MLPQPWMVFLALVVFTAPLGFRALRPRTFLRTVTILVAATTTVAWCVVAGGLDQDTPRWLQFLLSITATIESLTLARFTNWGETSTPNGPRRSGK